MSRLNGNRNTKRCTTVHPDHLIAHIHSGIFKLESVQPFFTAYWYSCDVVEKYIFTFTQLKCWMSGDKMKGLFKQNILYTEIPCILKSSINTKRPFIRTPNSTSSNLNFSDQNMQILVDSNLETSCCTATVLATVPVTWTSLYIRALDHVFADHVVK